MCWGRSGGGGASGPAPPRVGGGAPKPVGEWTLRRLECGDAWAVLNWVTLKTVPGALASQRRECENQGIRRRKVQRCPELSSFPVLQWRLQFRAKRSSCQPAAGSLDLPLQPPASDGHEQFDLVRRHWRAGENIGVCGSGRKRWTDFPFSSNTLQRHSEGQR